MLPCLRACRISSYVKQLQHLPKPATGVRRPCLPSRRHYAADTPDPRHSNNQPASNADARQPGSSPEPASPTWPNIADIVAGTQDCGAEVYSPTGRLMINSRSLSRRPHKTALVAPGTNPSLTEDDFRAVLEYQRGDDGGLEDVIPLRDPDTLQRTDAWALMFTSPAQAARYQETVFRLKGTHWLKEHGQNAVAVNPGAVLTPPLRVGHTKSHGFLSTKPFQCIFLNARLSPFDPHLEDAITAHRELTRPRILSQRRYPVKLFVRDQGVLSAEYIKRLLHLDGIGRGRPWAVSDSENAIIQVGYEVAARTNRVAVDDNWRVDFLAASEAAQFVRMWNKRPLPMLDDAKGGVILKAECLF